jgi:hypothetical protein
MSADTIHTAEVLISGLPTKSVTITPTNATVVREIQDISVQVCLP